MANPPMFVPDADDMHQKLQSFNNMLDREADAEGFGVQLPLLRDMAASPSSGIFFSMTTFAKSEWQKLFRWRHCSAHKQRLQSLDMNEPVHEFRRLLAEWGHNNEGNNTTDPARDRESENISPSHNRLKLENNGSSLAEGPQSQRIASMLSPFQSPIAASTPTSSGFSTASDSTGMGRSGLPSPAPYEKLDRDPNHHGSHFPVRVRSPYGAINTSASPAAYPSIALSDTANAQHSYPWPNYRDSRTQSHGVQAGYFQILEPPNQSTSTQKFSGHHIQIPLNTGHSYPTAFNRSSSPSSTFTPSNIDPSLMSPAKGAPQWPSNPPALSPIKPRPVAPQLPPSPPTRKYATTPAPIAPTPTSAWTQECARLEALRRAAEEQAIQQAQAQAEEEAIRARYEEQQREEEERRARIKEEILTELRGGADVLAYRYREYIQYVKPCGADRMSKYHLSLIANQLVDDDDTGESAELVRYAKKYWYSYWEMKHKDVALEFMKKDIAAKRA